MRIMSACSRCPREAPSVRSTPVDCIGTSRQHGDSGAKRTIRIRVWARCPFRMSALILDNWAESVLLVSCTAMKSALELHFLERAMATRRYWYGTKLQCMRKAE